MIKWIKNLFVSKRLRAATQRIEVLEDRLKESRDEVVNLLIEQESLKEMLATLKVKQNLESNIPDGDMIRDVMLNPEIKPNTAEKA